MTKRKAPQAKPLEELQEPVEEKAPAPLPRVQCTYSGRVVVNDAPSGTRYDFQPGEVQPVKIEDLQHLLSKKRGQPSSCCGGAAPQDVYYFKEI